MNRLFNLDNPVWTFLSKCCDVLLLSILWILFSLPVVTIGPASAALYHSVHKCIYRDEGYVFRTFWKSFRTNLKQGVILTLLCLPVAAFIVVSYLFADAMGTDSFLGTFYKIVSLVIAFFLLSVMLYLFPLLSRFFMKTTDILKTALAFAVTRIGFTLILDLLALICALGIYLAPVTGFLLPALTAMAAERLIEPAFTKALEATQKTAADSETAEKATADSETDQ